ncbi:DUF4038 domain-containing protein [Candidatus Woesebacteria bacterium]|nr:DUF4038 domain-containing protein [Candidatus Woesebacteria bacterium]
MHILFQKHGAVLVKNGKLEHEDGTQFFWLGDTQWFAMTSRCTPDDLKRIVAIRSSQGFTGIQIVVGIPPEVSPWSKNARNSGGFPFNRDHTINTDYFTEVTQKLSIILDAGLVPMIVGGWGHHIDTFGVDLYILWWKEILQRYSHLPVLFCLAGEVDFFPGTEYGEQQKNLYTVLRSLLPGKVKNGISKLRTILNSTKSGNSTTKRLEMWNAVGKWVQEHDQFHRPLTIHPHSKKSARELFPNATWLTINGIQSGHSKDSYNWMKEKTVQETQFSLPFINLEPWYEGIFNSFGLEWQEKALQVILDTNAAGMTYGAQGMWNMNSKQDSFLEHWGAATWEDALQFPGASHIGKIPRNKNSV